jgi:pseudouridine-5'-phosphate glycosidase
LLLLKTKFGQKTQVVALESTIISHGMPFPQNLETARAVEALIREGGAVPATICVLGGVARVGVEDVELTKLAELGLKVRKTGTRDLPLLLSGIGDGNGATTVSATMWLVGLFCMY